MHFTDFRTGSTKARLTLALVITLFFVVIEALAGWWSNSLALLTDAAHNLTDVATLALTWYTLQLALRPAHSGKTFGYHRAGILAVTAADLRRVAARWLPVEGGSAAVVTGREQAKASALGWCEQPLGDLDGDA